MMKKSAALTLLVFAASPVFAAQQGGFIDPDSPGVQAKRGGYQAESQVVTVKQAGEMKDDSWITVRGKLEKQTGDEDYLFRDASGTMKVEIDHKRWNGLTITPKDTVELTGELDKDFNAVELDVKQVRKLP